MTNKIKSFILVAVQFLCALYFFLFVGANKLSIPSIILITAGIAIALWAILSMKLGNVHVSPIPKDSARLVMTGPYAFIRHPMYSAVLLAMLGIVINIDSLLAYGVWLALLVDLVIKLLFEERLLSEKFREYRVYSENTKRLIPFIW